MNEIIYAMIDGDGVVKNTIVVGVDWDLGGVPCGEFAVGDIVTGKQIGRAHV